MVILFCISFFAILYVYIGYPLLLYLVNSVIKRSTNNSRSFEPMVTIIIAAYNEESNLGAKIKNTLALDYPKDKIEIIIASDCSTDGTDEIARSFAISGVRHFRMDKRKGKTAAQNESVVRATGDILVFSDATTLYNRDSVSNLVQYFTDKRIGAVSGELTYVNPSGSMVGRGTNLYWCYERWLRSKESNICSMIGVSGCMYAVRKFAYQKIAVEMISDFIIALDLYSRGYRTVYGENAKCCEQTHVNSRDEYRMRVRIVVRSLNALWVRREILNPFKFGFYSIQIWSHKLFRYFAPIFLLALFVTNLFLLNQWIYWFTMAAQIGIYGSALLRHLSPDRLFLSRLCNATYYFVLVNIAALKGLIIFLLGREYILWDPVRR
jgi:cellulose synthase/poly-beta-1,6-N-acetylglucosamine synthase-like glycosyltransferase